MIVDIILIVAVVFLGGVLGLLVESMKYLYPIYLALLLLLAATLVTLFEKMMKWTARQEP